MNHENVHRIIQSHFYQYHNCQLDMLFFVLNDKEKYGKLLNLEAGAEMLNPYLAFTLLEIYVYAESLANMFVRLFFHKSAIYN